MSNDRLMKILLSPHISEKSTVVANLGQYVFEVVKDANKAEIKRAVEFLFNVSVKSVSTSNVKSKAKRFGQIEGRRKGWKKAYVSLQDGSKIDFTGAKS